jgi:hypothetical protein
MKFELVTYNRNTPDEDLLTDLKKVAVELGKKNITFREYNGRGKYNAGTIQVRFGGWNNALEKAGLAVKEYHNVDNQELLNDIKRVANEIGKETITSREYITKGRYSSSTIAERFGSWNEAIEEAGLTVKEYKNISIDALFENIEQVWLKLGRQPTYRDMKFPLSKYTASAYHTNFGTWQKALERFVEFINSEEVETEQTIKTKSEIVEPGNTVKSETAIHHKTNRNINLRLRFLVMRRDNFKCNACGKSPTNNPGTELHIDHIVAWDNGGETIFENLQTLCSGCNIGKSNLDFKAEEAQ